VILDRKEEHEVGVVVGEYSILQGRVSIYGSECSLAVPADPSGNGRVETKYSVTK
jgi:hypothetical protein